MTGNGGQLSNEQARQLAESITHGDEYQLYLDPQRPHKPSEWENMLKEVAEQLQSWWDKFRELFHLKNKVEHHLTPSWTREAMTWGSRVLLVIVIMAVLYALIRWGIGAYKQYKAMLDAEKRHPTITLEERQLQKNEYLQLAESAYQAQQYREAIHYLFLAAVTQVISHEQFHASHALTNREILTHCDFACCSAPTSAAQHFTHLVHYDERNWFGFEPAQSTDYTAMLSEYQSFSSSLGTLSEVSHA